MQDNADPILLGGHDVALASIEKVVAGEENVVPTLWRGFLFIRKLLNWCFNLLRWNNGVATHLTNLRNSQSYRCTTTFYSNILQTVFDFLCFCLYLKPTTRCIFKKRHSVSHLLRVVQIVETLSGSAHGGFVWRLAGTFSHFVFQLVPTGPSWWPQIPPWSSRRRSWCFTVGTCESCASCLTA